MKGLFRDTGGDGIDFELFSNIVLKFTAILMVVMVLLAINVGQKLDQIISQNSFSGGTARPQLFIGAWDTPHGMTISLDSPSFATAATNVKDGKTVSRKAGETFSGQYQAGPYEMLTLLAGIEPGSFMVDGKPSPLIVPVFTDKSLVDRDGRNPVPPSSDLALSFLRIWSSLYLNNIYPVRSFSDFKNSRSRIYIESVGNGTDGAIIIGNMILTKEKIEDGSFDFLTALSSTNTEFVYLGEFYGDEAKRTNTRIQFYEAQGYMEAAEAYRAFAYPGEKELTIALKGASPIKPWEQLKPEDRSEILKANNGDENLARQRYENYSKLFAISTYKNKNLRQFALDGKGDARAFLPPILKFPEAWKKYVSYRLSQNPIAPAWVVNDFLEPLGFNKRVVVEDPGISSR